MKDVLWVGNRARLRLAEEIQKCERHIELINNNIIPFSVSHPKKQKKVLSHTQHFTRGFFSI